MGNSESGLSEDCGEPFTISIKPRGYKSNKCKFNPYCPTEHKNKTTSTNIPKNDTTVKNDEKYKDLYINYYKMLKL